MSWVGSPGALSGRVVLSDDEWAMLAKLAGASEYWKTAYDFMRGVKGRELFSLTDKQLGWYYDIEARLAVEVWRLEAKRVFGMDVPND